MSAFVCIILSGCFATFENVSEFAFFLTHREKGTIYHLPEHRGSIDLLNEDFQTRTLRFRISSAFAIDIPIYEFIVIEGDPGTIEIAKSYYEKRATGDTDTDKRFRQYRIAPGQKIYANDSFHLWDEALASRLERWKPPYAYIKLCDHNTRVCDDSPWKPPAEAKPALVPSR